MIKLEFKDEVVIHRTGNKLGRAWETHAQEAWILRRQPNGTISPYPEKVVFLLNKDKDGNINPFEKGTYEYDVEASIYIGDFDSLRLGRPVLKKVEANNLQKVA